MSALRTSFWFAFRVLGADGKSSRMGCRAWAEGGREFWLAATSRVQEVALCRIGEDSCEFRVWYSTAVLHRSVPRHLPKCAMQVSDDSDEANNCQCLWNSARFTAF